MTRLPTLLACLLGFSPIAVGSASDEPVDGFYAYAATGVGPKVERVDGGDPVVLTKLLTTRLGEARMTSGANDNSRFFVTLDSVGPIPEGSDVGGLAVVIGGRAFATSHSDRREDGTIDLSGSIHGRETAKTMAKALGATPSLRKHPGHRMLVSVRPEAESYEVGEDVVLVMRIENVGRKTMNFMDGGSNRGPRNNQFGFTAFRNVGFGKALPDVGDPTNFGGIAGFQSLEPGEVFEKSVTLTDWFRFDEPDTYRVMALYRMEVNGWDDFAVAECFLRIRERSAD